MGRGYHLWGRGTTLLAQEFDAATLKLSSEPGPLADDVGIIGGSGFMAVAVSTVGTLLIAPASCSNLPGSIARGDNWERCVTRAST
jgi:hypothetical protein